ncbi:unnamed protein product [Fusarium langsethiae]|nr:unnamed protein product [Fusarium langsethiae]GKU17845.1 unnamed protein product [Fusarium langsethiae]
MMTSPRAQIDQGGVTNAHQKLLKNGPTITTKNMDENDPEKQRFHDSILRFIRSLCKAHSLIQKYCTGATPGHDFGSTSITASISLDFILPFLRHWLDLCLFGFPQIHSHHPAHVLLLSHLPPGGFGGGQPWVPARIATFDIVKTISGPVALKTPLPWAPLPLPPFMAGLALALALAPAPAPTAASTPNLPPQFTEVSAPTEAPPLPSTPPLHLMDAPTAAPALTAPLK